MARWRNRTREEGERGRVGRSEREKEGGRRQGVVMVVVVAVAWVWAIRARQHLLHLPPPRHHHHSLHPVQYTDGTVLMQHSNTDRGTAALHTTTTTTRPQPSFTQRTPNAHYPSSARPSTGDGVRRGLPCLA